ncbi:MAG: hypothetical protein JWP44_4840 [Mucilaginibacter sp.]|nr:hypothetical protein [Mucilaginibacter sp.]
MSDDDTSNPADAPIQASMSESLSLELKGWLDPLHPPHRAVIVKAIIALRNRDGGDLYIGFQNDGTPRSDRPDFDLRKHYHADAIQDLIARHASERFEVAVEFITLSDADCVRIKVPPGVLVPVAVRTPIKADDGKVDHLGFGEVPFRTLKANGRPSSAACQPGDWADLVNICFNNREADIGRFLRRHLTGAGPAIVELVKSLGGEAGDPSPAAPVVEFLARGEARFAAVLKDRPSPEAAEMAPWGSRSLAFCIEPPLVGVGANTQFLALVRNSIPKLTSYPPWIDTTTASDDAAPYVYHRTWETFFVHQGMFDMLSFSVLDPAGKFFERRLILHDVIARRRGEQAGQLFDPWAAVADVSEVLLTALAIANSFGAADESHTLSFAFMWNGLSGRRVNWPLPIRNPHVAREEYAAPCTVSFKADTPGSALAPFVELVLTPVLETFGGYSFTPAQYEEGLRLVMERRSPF